jgi:hypothetical protein
MDAYRPWYTLLMNHWLGGVPVWGYAYEVPAVTLPVTQRLLTPGVRPRPWEWWYRDRWVHCKFGLMGPKIRSLPCIAG